MSGNRQLCLFDVEKYSTPSCDGRPDWFFDTQEGVEYSPSVNRKQNNRCLGLGQSEGTQSFPTLLLSVSPPLEQISQPQKITGGGISTPGEEVIPRAIASGCTSAENFDRNGEGDRSIGGDRTGGENFDRNGEGDRSIVGKVNAIEQKSENLSMLQNSPDDGACSIASDSKLLTWEEGEAFWDALIFGRKTENPGRVALETPGKLCPDKPGRSDLKRMQDSHSTPDVAFIESRMNALYREERTLSDRRQGNGKPGASGWISVQFKYRDAEGKSQTSARWKAGCTGPYYQYLWREGDRIRSRYVPKKKLQQVEYALALGESVWLILDILD